MKKRTAQTKTTGTGQITFHSAKKNSVGTKSKNEPSFYQKTLLVDNQPIKFIVDTGALVKLLPKAKFNDITVIKPVTEDYRDVIDNKRKFEGKKLQLLK